MQHHEYLDPPFNELEAIVNVLQYKLCCMCQVQHVMIRSNHGGFRLSIAAEQVKRVGLSGSIGAKVRVQDAVRYYPSTRPVLMIFSLSILDLFFIKASSLSALECEPIFC